MTRRHAHRPPPEHHHRPDRASCWSSRVVTIGIKFSFGAFDAGYQLKASFAAAGQGLVPNSDVKIRGVNVGKVDKVELIDGRALVTMGISDGEKRARHGGRPPSGPRRCSARSSSTSSPGTRGPKKAADFYDDGD